MRSENPIHSNELTRLECKLKFFYFLRDLDIKAAIPAAAETFLEYMEKLSEIAITNEIGSDC